jgi:hypothetical protein
MQALVVPGSGLVKRQAEAEGLHRVFEAAGFEWREPGCSMCLGMNDDDRFPGYRLHLDLPAQALATPEGATHPFNLDSFRKRMLLEGLDDIEIMLREVAKIRPYEQRRLAQEPWLFPADRHADPPGTG